MKGERRTELRLRKTKHVRCRLWHIFRDGDRRKVYNIVSIKEILRRFTPCNWSPRTTSNILCWFWAVENFL